MLCYVDDDRWKNKTSEKHSSILYREAWLAATMSNRKPCRFFQQGNCKNGNRCSFAHVYENNTSRPSSAAPQTALQDFWSDHTLSQKEKEIKDAIGSYREMQVQPVTSSFGLGAPCLINVIDGRDYSSDESRWDFLQAQQSNSIPQYEQMLAARKQDMDRCIQYLGQNTQKAARYSQVMTRSKVQDPNMNPKSFMPQALDLNPNPSGVASPFGSTGGSNTTANPFGSQTGGALGSQPPNAFGSQTATTGGFGSQTTQTSSVFGSSAFAASKPLGSTSTTSSSFGSSAFGSNTFGSQPASGSPFVGATSNNTSSAFGSSGFGSASLGGTTDTKSAFGSSAFGANTKSTPFGSAGFGSSTFGQSTSSTTSPFGATSSTISPFGALGASGTTEKPVFGGSTFGQQTPATSAFGASSLSGFGGSTTSGFGSSTTLTTSPFGSNAPGAASSVPPSSNITPAINTNPFGSSAPSSTSAFGIAASGFGKSSRNSAFGSSAFGSSGFGSNNANDGFGGATSGSGEFQPRLIQSAKEPARHTEKDLPESVLAQFKADKFTLGQVPEVAPPLAFC